MKPVRSLAFSPTGKLLAAAGDSRVIALYDTSSGMQVAHLAGHSAWILSLDWSNTGEYLLSGYVFTIYMCSVSLREAQILNPTIALLMER